MKKTDPNIKPAESGYADVNGLQMYYEVYGAGKPIVLVHKLKTSRLRYLSRSAMPTACGMSTRWNYFASKAAEKWAICTGCLNPAWQLFRARLTSV